MKKLLLLCTLPLMALSGCVNTPEEVTYRGRMVKTVGPLSAGCDTPYELTQDCGSLTGGKRLIEIDGLRIRTAASEDGSEIMLQADSTFSLRSFELTQAAAKVEDYLKDEGFELLETIIAPVATDTALVFFKFDGDAYAVLKELTVEDES